MITSTKNERVKYIRSLVRRRVRQREGRFVVEGSRLAEELVRAGIRPAMLLYTPDWSESPAGRELLPRLLPAEEGDWPVSESVLAACSDTQTPQGVLAVVPFVSLPPKPGLILILDGLRDPGNLGTILRSAEAAGVGQVLLTPGTVDATNPKVVRGAMGAHFRLAVEALDWPAVVERVAGRAVWLASTEGGIGYDVVDWTLPSALIVGGEAAGTGEEAAALATGRVSVPMAGGAESLNAAMAATVLVFEAARQR
jgi:TrmH family RNA methyltransferase